MEHYVNNVLGDNFSCAGEELLDYVVALLLLSIILHEQHSFHHWLSTRVGHILSII